MKLQFSTRAWDDYRFWIDDDPKVRAKIDTLILDAMRAPFQGLGKPEPLKNDYAGWWSRRITEEHRMVYRVRGTGDEKVLEVAQLRFHYK